MNITFSSKQKFILFGVIFFCLGITVGTFGNLQNYTKLSSQYLGDPGLTCTRECYLISRGTFTVPGEESCPSEPVCGNGAVEGSETCDDGNRINNDGCSDSCSPDTMMMATSYCGNSMCDGGEDCNTCSSDCGMCYYAAPTTNYSYCYDSSACNAWQWVENGTCDYSCHTTTCQPNFHVENGSCVSDQIICREFNGNMQLEYSNGNTDFSDRVVALGQTDPNKSKYEIEYSATQTTLKSHMYVDGIDVPCPDMTKQNKEALDEPLETCEEMLQNMRNEGENTDGISCTGSYSFTIERNN